jgi:hypothetical protein
MALWFTRHPEFDSLIGPQLKLYCFTRMRLSPVSRMSGKWNYLLTSIAVAPTSLRLSCSNA